MGNIAGMRVTVASRYLMAWLSAALDDPGPFTLTPIGGGNSNETLLLESPAAPAACCATHRPPRSRPAPTAWAGSAGPRRDRRPRRARPGAARLRRGAVPGGPWLAMEMVDGVSLTEELPPDYRPGAESVAAVGEAAIDALVALHRVDWRAAGLDEFGRPEGFLERQVGRWRAHFERHRGPRAARLRPRRRLARRQPARAAGADADPAR